MYLISCKLMLSASYVPINSNNIDLPTLNYIPHHFYHKLVFYAFIVYF